jgi:hypothetical protein
MDNGIFRRAKLHGCIRTGRSQGIMALYPESMETYHGTTMIGIAVSFGSLSSLSTLLSLQAYITVPPVHSIVTTAMAFFHTMTLPIFSTPRPTKSATNNNKMPHKQQKLFFGGESSSSGKRPRENSPFQSQSGGPLGTIGISEVYETLNIHANNLELQSKKEAKSLPGQISRLEAEIMRAKFKIMHMRKVFAVVSVSQIRAMGLGVFKNDFPFLGHAPPEHLRHVCCRLCNDLCPNPVFLHGHRRHQRFSGPAMGHDE